MRKIWLAANEKGAKGVTHFSPLRPSCQRGKQAHDRPRLGASLMMKLFAALALSVTIVSAGICNDKRPDCTNWARDNECMGDNAVRSHYPTALGHGPPTQLLGVVPTEIHGNRMPPVLRHLHTHVQRHGPLLRGVGHRW